jgi:hypothetical protein
MLELPEEITVRSCKGYWLSEHEVYGVKVKDIKRDDARLEVARICLPRQPLPDDVSVNYDKGMNAFAAKIGRFDGLEFHGATVREIEDQINFRCKITDPRFPKYVQWTVYSPKTDRFIAIHGTFTNMFATGYGINEAIWNLVEKCRVNPDLCFATTYIGSPEVPAKTVEKAVAEDLMHKEAEAALINQQIAEAEAEKSLLHA